MARRLWSLLGIVVLLGVGGCSGAGGSDDGATGVPSDGLPSASDIVSPGDGDGPTDDGSDDGSTSVGTPGATDEDGVRFRLRCFAEDGRQLGDFDSLAVTWASSNYLKIEYCDARYVGPEPLALTLEEAAVAEIAALGVDGEPGDLFLQTYAACTRLGADDGEHSISGTPVSILEATLTLCPQAPQSGLIEKWLGVTA